MSMNLPIVNEMKEMTRFGLAALGVGAILGATLLPGKAETPDTFTRHGLPIPGAYFAKRESQQPATVAVNKSGSGVGEHKSKPEKQNASRTKN
jgi:hypothetical protein